MKQLQVKMKGNAKIIGIKCRLSDKGYVHEHILKLMKLEELVKEAAKSRDGDSRKPFRRRNQ